MCPASAPSNPPTAPTTVSPLAVASAVNCAMAALMPGASPPLTTMSVFTVVSYREKSLALAIVQSEELKRQKNQYDIERFYLRMLFSGPATYNRLSLIATLPWLD
jgi:hypothetical protein